MLFVPHALFESSVGARAGPTSCPQAKFDCQPHLKFFVQHVDSIITQTNDRNVNNKIRKCNKLKRLK